LDSLIKKMSGKQIGIRYGVTPEAVYYRLRTWGIRNSKRQRRFDPPKAELLDLYKELSMDRIAQHYGVGETVVFMRLKEHGISGISRGDRMRGKPKTTEHRLALSRVRVGRQIGSKNPNWRGGISTANKLGRSRKAFHDWRLAVLTKADWKCEGCGLEQGSMCGHCGHRIRLHAHHVKEFAEYPEGRYDPLNGRALCERCHFAEHHKQSGELLETP
jgi:hypothetical protein